MCKLLMFAETILTRSMFLFVFVACRRRNVVYRCFYQDHGVEVIQTVNEETVLQSLNTSLATDSEVNHGNSQVDGEALRSSAEAEVLLPTLQVRLTSSNESRRTWVCPR